MAAPAQEQTAFDLLLSKLPKEEAQQIQEGLTGQNPKDFLTHTVATTLQAHPEIDLGGYKNDDVLRAAEDAWYQRNPLGSPQQVHTDSSQQDVSLSDFFPDKKASHGGGGYASSTPERLLLSLQEEELIKDKGLMELFSQLQKDSESPDTQESLNQLLQELDAKTLLQRQHDLVKQLLEKYVSANKKLTQEQKNTILEAAKKEFSHTEKIDEFDRSDDFSKAREENSKLSDRLKKAAQEKTSPETALRTIIREQQQLVRQHQPRISQFLSKKEIPYNLDAFFSALYEELEAYDRRARQYDSRSRSHADAGLYTDRGGFTPQSAMANPSQPPQQLSRPTERGANPVGRSGSLGRRLVGKAAKKLLKKTLMWIATHTPQGWAAIGIIALIVLVIVTMIAAIVIIIAATSSSSQTPTLGSSCTTSADCVTKLEAFGINPSGDLSLNGDPLGKARVLYDLIHLVTTPPSDFANMLQIPKNPVSVVFHPDQSCRGHASTDGTVDYYGWCANVVIDKFLLLHELGHEVAFRNPQTYFTFWAVYTIRSIFDKNLPTYNCELDYGPNGPYPAECFADSLAEYVFYPIYRHVAGGLPVGSTNFPDFPSFAGGFYYNFMSDNIYKGTDFSKLVQ